MNSFVKEPINKTNNKIIVVDDDEISYILINEIFLSSNVNILWAKDAKEAITLYKENQKDISLIIMDIQLPKISGYEATKILKKYDSNITIIAITAFERKYSYTDSINAGCNDFISKPINPYSFKRTIEKHLYQTT
ncbi:MAG: response regulator [Bacteroidales bacterium]|jgi:CheY-like chemotaxis protein|nr:response regulator [Bacteroidales bacterium]